MLEEKQAGTVLPEYMERVLTRVNQNQTKQGKKDFVKKRGLRNLNYRVASEQESEQGETKKRLRKSGRKGS